MMYTNQTGCVKGKFIGDVARSIIDFMEGTKQQNIPGILSLIDLTIVNRGDPRLTMIWQGFW